MLLIKKLMVFVLVFAILIVLREAFDFGLKFISNSGEKYQPSKGRMVLLASAISYIFTIIFTGFRVL